MKKERRDWVTEYKELHNKKIPDSLVDFYAEWCGPGLILDQLSKDGRAFKPTSSQVLVCRGQSTHRCNTRFDEIKKFCCV